MVLRGGGRRFVDIAGFRRRRSFQRESGACGVFSMIICPKASAASDGFGEIAHKIFSTETGCLGKVRVLDNRP
jgi:hypothetical protein